MLLSDAEIERYARQLVMPELGEAGQAKLRAARILVLGAGGLGAPVLAGLAGAGVGQLTIIDDDVVDITNLNRQFIHQTSDLSATKTKSADDFIRQLNPNISVTCQQVRFDAQNAHKLATGHDLVIDCTDNPETRYLANAVCQQLGTPLIFGGAVRSDGQITSFVPNDANSPCLRCIFPHTDLDYDQAPNCANAGILGSTTMVIGGLQTAEALKIIAGFGTPLIGRLLLYDGLANSFTEIEVAPNPACPVCGNK
ncbi:MAG: HesA/MoeB/ThiF family protein [Alphaproteobacteria bacterium]|nr:HesA/MoeB/ThiF family protein [Alphaproteobacteria bacterium]